MKPQYINQIKAELICLKSWWGVCSYLLPSRWREGTTLGPQGLPGQFVQFDSFPPSMEEETGRVLEGQSLDSCSLSALMCGWVGSWVESDEA